MKDELDQYLKKAIKDIQEFSKSELGLQTSFLGDYYDFLSFFEQLCVVYERGDSTIYFGVDNYIEEVCKGVVPYDIDIQFELKNRISDFLANYTNKNIRKAQEVY